MAEQAPPPRWPLLQHTAGGNNLFATFVDMRENGVGRVLDDELFERFLADTAGLVMRERTDKRS